MVRVGFLVIALAFSTVWPQPRAGASSQPLCPANGPAAVVLAYYQALNRHRGATAKACLTHQYLARLTAPNVMDPDWENVIAARVVKLTTRRVSDSLLPPDITPLPYRAVQVAARVIMRYRRIGGSPNGLNIWFIYVIKEGMRSPWRIADIGSGP